MTNEIKKESDTASTQKLIVYHKFANDCHHYCVPAIAVIPQKVTANEFVSEMESRYTGYRVICELPLTTAEATDLLESMRLGIECEAAIEAAEATEATPTPVSGRLKMANYDAIPDEEADDMSWAQ